MSEILVERATFSPALAEELGRLTVHLTDESAGQQIPEDLLRVGTDTPYAATIIAKNGDEVVGSSSLTQLAGLLHRDAWLNDVVVAPDWRKQGTADLLANEWEAWCQEREIETLKFTSGWNRAAAHKFYLRRGAVILNPEGGKTAFFNYPIPERSQQ